MSRNNAVHKEIQWFKEYLFYRLNQNKNPETASQAEPAPPAPDGSYYSVFAEKWQLSPEERIVLVLGLLPNIAPEKLDVFRTVNENTGRMFTEFGGKKMSSGQLFYPTIETALHLLAGYDIERRIEVSKIFDSDSKLIRNGILVPDDPQPGEPRNSAAIVISEDVIDLLTRGETRIPTFGTNFPAKLYTSALDWDDMVFGHNTRTMLEDVKAWLMHHRQLLDEMGYGRRLGKGYKALFHGPPGNGKSVTAALLGKFIGKDVLRIDLSMVVSKFIGETEKNLKKVFDRAERTNAILFFDEADALFGKRTATKDAHDRYANQEVNYLLQRIEEFYGIIFLATNFKNNLDDAFTRRFNTMVHFPMPDAGDRLQMWQKAFTSKTSFAPDVKLNDFAEKYSISYAQIANVGAWCTLMAIEKNNFVIDYQTIRAGLARELGKEGRTL